MKSQGFFAVTGGVMVLSVGLLLTAGCGSGGDSDVQAQNAGVIDLSGVRHKAMPAASRCVVLAAFDNAAVRDNEMGLVWERSPQLMPAVWFEGRGTCADKTVGNRKGWRLPSFPELASLMDPSVSPGPTLPVGHPFTNVQSFGYWSATTNAGSPTLAWAVIFSIGIVGPADKSLSFRVWCVRGGMNAEAY